jgi:hypothetical protein
MEKRTIVVTMYFEVKDPCSTCIMLLNQHLDVVQDIISGLYPFRADGVSTLCKKDGDTPVIVATLSFEAATLDLPGFLTLTQDLAASMSAISELHSLQGNRMNVIVEKPTPDKERV